MVSNMKIMMIVKITKILTLINNIIFKIIIIQINNIEIILNGEHIKNSNRKK